MIPTITPLPGQTMPIVRISVVGIYVAKLRQALRLLDEHHLKLTVHGVKLLKKSIFWAYYDLRSLGQCALAKEILLEFADEEGGVPRYLRQDAI